MFICVSLKSERKTVIPFHRVRLTWGKVFWKRYIYFYLYKISIVKVNPKTRGRGGGGLKFSIFAELPDVAKAQKIPDIFSKFRKFDDFFSESRYAPLDFYILVICRDW